MVTLLRFTDVLLLRPLLNTYNCLCAFYCGGRYRLSPSWVCRGHDTEHGE